MPPPALIVEDAVRQIGPDGASRALGGVELLQVVYDVAPVLGK